MKIIIELFEQNLSINNQLKIGIFSARNFNIAYLPNVIKWIGWTEIYPQEVANKVRAEWSVPIQSTMCNYKEKYMQGST